MPLPTAAPASGNPRRKGSFPRRAFEWLLNPNHFHFKLLVGTSIGVVAVGLLAAACLVVTSGDQKREEIRARSIEVMRLSNVVENDIALMENTYRGNLLRPSADSNERFKRFLVQSRKHKDELAYLVAGSEEQANRVLIIRNNIENWFISRSLRIAPLVDHPDREFDLRAALNSPALDQAHENTALAELQSMRAALESWMTQCAIPGIEAKRSGRKLPPNQNDSLLINLRRTLEQFDKEQTDIYQVRLAAVGRERRLTIYGINLLCIFTAGLMIASGSEPTVHLAEPTSGSGRVLIVDDEEAIRMLVDFFLTRLGYEVVAADNSLRGIEIYREEFEAGRRFDLVILDLTLPGGMGGKEALKKLIEIDPMVNAVVSSGYATDATMSRYEDFGFRGMIPKPYEAAELGRKVHALIEANRANPVPDYELQHAC